MPVPGGTGSEKAAADMQQIIKQIVIRNRYKPRQQPHNHTDKVEAAHPPTSTSKYASREPFSNSLFSENRMEYSFLSTFPYNNFSP